jgi:hypothetical protein
VFGAAGALSGEKPVCETVKWWHGFITGWQFGFMVFLR